MEKAVAVSTQCYAEHAWLGTMRWTMTTTKRQTFILQVEEKAKATARKEKATPIERILSKMENHFDVSFATAILILQPIAPQREFDSISI